MFDEQVLIDSLSPAQILDRPTNELFASPICTAGPHSAVHFSASWVG
ncbi:hypothetical protein SynPROS91_01727 [Synechococcus sp. PROS-9-1]|nr:hypothetical protein SynPROS91_01727 [Synechococcus sp. PROS-9-1]